MDKVKQSLRLFIMDNYERTMPSWALKYDALRELAALRVQLNNMPEAQVKFLARAKEIIPAFHNSYQQYFLCSFSPTSETQDSGLQIEKNITEELLQLARNEFQPLFASTEKTHPQDSAQ